jgi:penicillin-binding protein activator
MKRTMIAMMTGLIGVVVAVGGCSSANERITRVDPIKGGVDVNSRYNATDAQTMAESLINDMLSKPWIENARAANAGAGVNPPTPKMVLGTVKNKTTDYTIDMAMVTNQVQEELVNSGRVRVFAAKDIREELRAERFDTEFADPATVSKAASEIKAQFMLLGELLENIQVSGDGRTKDVYYELRLEMTDMATTEKLWIKTARSRKISER